MSHSYAKEMERGIFGTWQQKEWWVQALPEDWQALWRKTSQSPIELAVFLSSYFVKLIRNESSTLPAGHYAEIRYAELIAQPDATLHKIETAANLEKSSRVRKHIASLTLEDMNTKWQSERSDKEKRLLNDLIRTLAT